MSAWADRVLERFDALDRMLVARGWPATSPWWRSTIERFLRSGARALVVRAGRRAGKSSTMVRVAVTLALWGEHQIAPGDVGIASFTSIRVEEARARLRAIGMILAAIDVDHATRGDSIVLQRYPIVFAVQPASTSAVIGGTSIVIVDDEVSSWRNADDSANPAKEVIAQQRPTMATTPNSRMFVVSSPLGSLDHHAELFDRGDVAGVQVTAFCASWTGNPTLNEEATHQLEPDVRLWRRGFAAIPQESRSPALDAAHVAAAFEERCSTLRPTTAWVTALDASSLRRDHFVACNIAEAVEQSDPEQQFLHAPVRPLTDTGPDLPPVFDDRSIPRRLVIGDDGRAVRNPAYRTPADGPVVCVDRFLVFAPDCGLSLRQIGERIAGYSRERGATRWVGDGHERLGVSTEAKANGMRFDAVQITATLKSEGVVRLRRLLAERRIVLPDDAPLRRELETFEERITPNGLVYAQRRDEGGGHFDRVGALISFFAWSIDTRRWGEMRRGGHRDRLAYEPMGMG